MLLPRFRTLNVTLNDAELPPSVALNTDYRQLTTFINIYAGTQQSPFLDVKGVRETGVKLCLEKVQVSPIYALVETNGCTVDV